MSLGERLKKLREERHWTLKQVGEKIGVHLRNISNYERGFREPDVDTLRRLAEIYDVTIDYLLGKTDNTKEAVLASNEDLLEFLSRPGAVKFRGRLLTEEERNQVVRVVSAMLKDTD